VQTEADEEVSLNFMGQGFNRVLNMYCRIIASDRKIILIDEIELGLHHKSIPLVWDALKKISLDRDLQMFITTHSNECIQAAVETFKEQPEIFQLIRLEKHRSSVIAKCIPHDYVDAALEHDVEIR
jgi:AAA15 family ATPase/GTPase